MYIVCTETSEDFFNMFVQVNVPATWLQGTDPFYPWQGGFRISL